ncbi:hypothetical protein [Oxynema aestuarii]|uniref:Uncharacterized protein n=1 Tax=Oxynema aestuarii AP17 TaxID=2064643 RepID=A0A6H1U1W7_9CYAN|nr:hypothetical protein [Oxynema aestuarii]QIZ72023.1 hypothetical protein HCG48_16725 [Oxynema aestuarii AP17]RMH72441.1 MAG: hypothetical protein D6680_19380 [Cyanobacteria bacterium J007]
MSLFNYFASYFKIAALAVVLGGAFPTSCPQGAIAAPHFDRAGAPGCQVRELPPAGDRFYAKACTVEGMTVTSSARVSDRALEQAAAIARQMLAFRPDIRRKMLQNHLRIGIIGVREQTTDLPEYRILKQEYPDRDWDRLTRGLGGTPFIPLVTAAEENLLCWRSDRYFGENIFVHEFAHTIKDLGIVYLDRTFQARLNWVYRQAIAAGLWRNTYAAVNPEEYWAEGVQSYFNVNLEVNSSNGIHNQINTREELRAYDPRLYQLIFEIFGDTQLVSPCPLDRVDGEFS